MGLKSVLIAICILWLAYAIMQQRILRNEDLLLMAEEGRHQRFDSTLKGLFETYAAFILPLLVKGVSFVEALDIELLLPPLRVDRVYKVFYRERLHILHLEFEASNNDEETLARLLVYHALIYRKYHLPVLTVYMNAGLDVCCKTSRLDSSKVSFAGFDGGHLPISGDNGNVTIS